MTCRSNLLKSFALYRAVGLLLQANVLNENCDLLLGKDRRLSEFLLESCTAI